MKLDGAILAYHQEIEKYGGEGCGEGVVGEGFGFGGGGGGGGGGRGRGLGAGGAAGWVTVRGGGGWRF